MVKSMRDAFLDELYDIARKDSRVMLLSNDFGAPSLDKFRADLDRQFIHSGIAEQNMVNVASGLALAGKIPYLYSIAPFLPLRCYEQMRVHLSFKKYHITGVAVGAGFSYDLSGPSHQALEDIAVMNALPGMTILTASDSVMAEAFARMTYTEPGPKYVRFDREALPDIYEDSADFSDGAARLREGKDLTIIATGIMVRRAFEIADELAKHSLEAGVIDLYRPKPLNEDLLFDLVSPNVVTLEESFITSGIGQIISAAVADRDKNIRLKRFGVPDLFYPPGRSRQELQRLSGLDTEHVVSEILNWHSK